MSHYSVAVITDDLGKVDQILAPFDENIELPRYIKYNKQQLIEKGKKEIEDYKNGIYAEFLSDPEKYKTGCKNKSHIDYLENDFPKKLNWTDEEIFQNEIRGYDESEIDQDFNVWSTYNPQSKWDWYQVGGRWGGMLLTNRGEVDQAKFKDILFEQMKENAYNKLKENGSWDNTKKWYKEKYVSERWENEEAYLQEESSFNTYAVVTPDGKWNEPGKIGWWGISHSEVKDEIEWFKNYHKNFVVPYLNSDYYLVIVDCHI